MLTADLVIYEYRNSCRIPDRLKPKLHGDYVDRARRAIEVYTTGIGQRRHEIHDAVDAIFDDDEHYQPKRVQALCRLLDKKSSFKESAMGASLKLRTEVFSQAAAAYPVVEKPGALFGATRSQVVADIAARLDRPWPEIEDALFDDALQFQRLRSFEGYPRPEDLLNHYNVAQFQAALYDAVNMTVSTGSNLKEVLRYAKLARLLHTITRKPDGTYHFHFDGPASLMSLSQQYGHRMARMIPGLLACDNWELTANFDRKGWRSSLSLKSGSGLVSTVEAAPEFDSDLEADFFEKWGPTPREGWSLTRESEVLHNGQHVFVPDFRLQQEDGRMVHLEIVGYWTDKYLKAKQRSLSLFPRHPILLAVSESNVAKMAAFGAAVIPFAKKLKPSAVIEAVSKL